MSLTTQLVIKDTHSHGRHVCIAQHGPAIRGSWRVFRIPPSSPHSKAQRGKDFFSSIPRVAETGLLLLLLFGPAYWEHPKKLTFLFLFL